MWATKSSATAASATSVTSSLCLAISESSRSNGPEKTGRLTSKDRFFKASAATGCAEASVTASHRDADQRPKPLKQLRCELVDPGREPLEKHGQKDEAQDDAHPEVALFQLVARFLPSDGLAAQCEDHPAEIGRRTGDELDDAERGEPERHRDRELCAEPRARRDIQPALDVHGRTGRERFDPADGG